MKHCFSCLTYYISNQLYLKGKDHIKLYPTGLCCPTRSSSLPRWLNPRSSSNNLLKFANAVRKTLFVRTYNWSVLILGDLGLFYVLSFRLVMLANAVIAEISNQQKVKMCK